MIVVGGGVDTSYILGCDSIRNLEVSFGYFTNGHNRSVMSTPLSSYLSSPL